MIFFDYFAFLLLVITVLNLISVKTLKPGTNGQFDFSILVPMRDEADNVSALLPTLMNQGGKVIVLNDQSTDATLENLQSFLPQIEIIQGLELPDEWLGKNYACHQLAVHAKSEYLVFVDADVRLKEGAINSAISFMVKKEWDFISPYPRQHTSGFLQLLIQPLLQWSWFSSIPFIYAYRYPNKSMSVANGQFLIVNAVAYRSVDGHKGIKSEVLDDIELARSLIGSGFKGGPVDGSVIAECQMYKGSNELIAGYTKSLWRAFGSPIGAIIAIAVLMTTAIPFLRLTAGLFFILLSRALVSIKVRSNLLVVIFHPIAMIMQSLLIIYSLYLHRMGRLSWRGRSIK